MNANAPTADAYPQSLSPSRANDFQTCPLLYRLRSIDRLPEEPSPAALRGTLVHEALEHLFTLDPAERTLPAATVLVREALARLEGEEPESFAALRAELRPDLPAVDVAESILRPAGPLLETYFALEDPARITPHARELAVSAELEPGFHGRGFIDRVEIAPDGRVRIVDYKTGRAPGPRFESKAMFQMRFYALLWWRISGVVPSMLQLMYLGNGQILRLEPTEDQLLATESAILAIRDAIRQAVREGFTPSPSRLCDWCSYQELCPAFDGTPPSMPDVSALLEPVVSKDL